MHASYRYTVINEGANESGVVLGHDEICSLGADLQGLRQLCTEHGALLCFDEVMTGFRIAKGCAQEHFGIMPDLTTVCPLTAS